MFSRRRRWTSARSSATSWHKVFTRIINSEEELIGRQTCTSWPSMTSLVYPTRQKKKRGWFPFIQTRETS